ncbi:YajG family lipoprotein [Psychromonas sp. psych-6C06]|uniref:YajG family lipoprotein n=1 Tax=Psychromonas sp. psych-6C06 TaxID=2058089 RepID=UPI001EE69CA2|nr:YajG family lipoprotein [Psychromonas sp. psych-6C06]
MKRISLTLPAILASIALLSGCSSTPNNLQLTPKLSNDIVTKEVNSEHIWLLDSQDLRSARYLIAISSGDDVATLINESSSTKDVITETLRTHWVNSGHRFTNKKNNDTQINVQLIQLLAEVEEHTVSHESDINVVIKVQLSSDKKTFSKTFRAHYEEEAPFGADVEKISAQLNTQLSQLLDQIVQDPELNAKLLQL